MNLQVMLPPRRRPRRWAWFCLLAVVGIQAGALGACAANLDRGPAPAVLAKTQAGIQALALRAPLAADWWGKIYGPISSALDNRQRMIQVGAICMIVGIYIIWWRK